MEQPTGTLEKSETIGKLAEALALFQGEIKVVEKSSVNPFFKSKYANLEDIIKTIRGPLAKNKLSISQFPIDDGGLATILMHVSGEYITATYRMKPKDNTPQGVGSALTYMRRYALGAILNLGTGEGDDDGNAASQSPKVQRVMHNQHQDHRGEEVEIVTYGADYIEDEPLAPPVVVKKAVSTNVMKKQILASITTLGMPHSTKEEIHASVKKVTEMELVEENYPAIVTLLGDLVEFEAK